MREKGPDTFSPFLRLFSALFSALIGLEQALAFAFVFPGEVAFPPDVGPAIAAAAGLVDAALERVPGTLRIGGRRLGLPEQLAQVEEMLLRGAALGELRLLPLGDELLRRHEGFARRV